MTQRTTNTRVAPTGKGFEQFLDRLDLLTGLRRSGFDRFQQIENPRFPPALLGHFAEMAVIQAFVRDDVAAEKKDRLVEQMREQQVENQDDPPGAPVAIVEGMDGLELVVNDGHFDERIEPAGVFVREDLQILQKPLDDLLALGRRINGFARGGIGDARAGDAPEPGAVALDGIHNVDEQAGGKKRPVAQAVRSFPKGVVVVQNLLFFRREARVVEAQVSVKFVVGRENVLDLGTRPRFLQRDGVEQDLRVGNGIGPAFEFGETAARRDGGLQDCRGFQGCDWRQRRQVVVGAVAVEHDNEMRRCGLICK